MRYNRQARKMNNFKPPPDPMHTHNAILDRNDPLVRFVSKSLHIGSLLLEEMLKKGYDDASVTKKLGITDVTLRSYISGNHDFTLREIATIESLFNEDFIKILH